MYKSIGLIIQYNNHTDQNRKMVSIEYTQGNISDMLVPNQFHRILTIFVLEDEVPDK